MTISKLSPDERLRYARHLSLEGFGESHQQRLKEASVLVIGVGGLGCPVLQYLVAAGVGTIGIVDGDKVSVSNLQRQVLFSTPDVRKSKVEVAVKKLQNLNPHTEFISHYCFLTKDNALKIIPEYDIVIDGSDNFSCRYLVNDACVLSDKPFVSGSIFKFEGQVSVYNYRGGATYRCLYPTPPHPKQVPNCSEIGVIGVIPGIVGNIMAGEAIKVLAGIGEPLSGKLWTIDLLTVKTQLFYFKKDKNIPKVVGLGDYDFESCDTSTIIEITPESFAEIRSEDFFILDVREPFEYDICHLENSCLIPLGVLLDRVSEIPYDKKILSVCHYGMRSIRALEYLERQGFTDLYNLSGGIDAWAQKVDPGMGRY